MKLTKMVKEKDVQSASLINSGKRIRIRSLVKAHTRKDHIMRLNPARNDWVMKQSRDMIANTIRVQYGAPSRDTLVYSELYTRRIDNLRMLTGYQPPKFQQFDRKGNLKQHVAHFVETCNNAGTEDDHPIKQFVRSLKGMHLIGK
ncbi:hypothetical protein L3X38_026723 [Prunus dulcis]|uniref:Uncharacterized protein n=1 Tax=Prunus dulcis TaxID=3755 RepID=A0AAD4VND1_PRUDU|nr:hypothetical protein L3X38_026723 [Prunus dulcis]